MRNPNVVAFIGILATCAAVFLSARHGEQVGQRRERNAAKQYQICMGNFGRESDHPNSVELRQCMALEEVK
jgi:hypothetical protein